MAVPTDDDNAPDRAKIAVRLLGNTMLRGAIPIAWLQAASRLPGRSLHAGVALWIAALKLKTRVVPLSNLDSMKFGFGRNQKYRALAWLESAGLVSVRWQLGRSPVVTIIDQHRDVAPADEAVERSGTAKAAGAIGRIHARTALSPKGVGQ